MDENDLYWIIDDIIRLYSDVIEKFKNGRLDYYDFYISEKLNMSDFIDWILITNKH